MKKRAYTTAVILLVLALGVGGAVILHSELDYRRGARDYEAAAEVARLPAALDIPQLSLTMPESEKADPYMELLASTDLASLQAINDEVVGWIMIPNTKISYPFLQAEDNHTYLKRTWSGEKSSAGAIFLECTNPSDFSGFNTIIYGHNLRSGAMFGGLKEFREADYWQTHSNVYLVNGENVYCYEIFAGYEAGLRDIVYRLDITESALEEEFLKYSQEKSLFNTGIQPDVTDRILTLSTCTGHGHSTRWIIQAVLRKEIPKDQLILIP